MVNDHNPTGLGGSAYFFPARGPGNIFPFTQAGFAAANAQADAKRIMSFVASGESTALEKYANYCCRSHNVWRQSVPGGGSSFVTVLGMDSPGLGFTHVAGPMCCEHAAIAAGTTAGCGTLKLSNGSSVVFTANGVFPVGGVPITIGSITISPNGTVGVPTQSLLPPVPPVSGVAPQQSTPPAPVLGSAPPVLGVRPQQPPPAVVPPPPVVANIPQRPQPPQSPPPRPAEAYYVVALDREIGLVVATQESIRTRPYCSWTGGGPQPCTGPANVLMTLAGPYASVDEAKADMRARLDCESGHWGAFVRSGNSRFNLQNNLGAADCRSVRRH